MASAALLVALTACGGGEGGTAGPKPCGTLPTQDPAARLPVGFPALADQVLYDPGNQGATRIVFGLLGKDDFVAVRDELVDRLTAAGYAIAGTDQEEVEAEAEFTGKQEGTVKVQPYCKGHVTIRYTFR